MSPQLANETLRLKAPQLNAAFQSFLLSVPLGSDIILVRRAFDAGARAIVEGLRS
jgi:hypothetical protein